MKTVNTFELGGFSNSQTASRPLTLDLAETVDNFKPSGHYDEKAQTWSDRRYETAGEKKHNEDM